MENQDICPKCGYKEFVEGSQMNYGAVWPNKIFTLRRESLHHIICLNCGTVVRSYVKNPHNLVIKNKNEI